MRMTPNKRFALIVAALVVFDGAMAALVILEWGTADGDRGHRERLNGDVVWAYDR